MAHGLIWTIKRKTRRSTGDPIVFHTAASDETSWEQIAAHVREALLKALRLFDERLAAGAVPADVDSLHVGVNDIGTLRLCLSSAARQWVDDGPFVLLHVRLVNRTYDQELLPHMDERWDWVSSEHEKLRQRIFDAVRHAAADPAAQRLLGSLRARRSLRAISRVDEETDEPVFPLDI